MYNLVEFKSCFPHHTAKHPNRWLLEHGSDVFLHFRVTFRLPTRLTS